MSQKRILVIHLNEFNFNFLKKGANKYKCSNINKILKYKKIKTYSVDKIQDKNLDPWVQSLSINTGIKSKNHKILNLGQQIPKKINQIWDFLSKKKINCAVWGVMNSSYVKNKNIKIFFPDPWNNNVVVKPNSLNKIFALPKSYAQNYTDFKIFKNIKNIFLFLIACFQYGVISYFFKNFFYYFKLFVSSRFHNYFLFFLFDIMSVNLFKNITKNAKLNFSLIFLNSLAHFQHNNWDEKRNFYKYFLLTEEICKTINEISLNYDDVLIYNGFTQKKIKPEFIIRPKNPTYFLKKIGIQFNELNSNMTNGGIIYFNNQNQKKDSIKKLRQINFYGFKIFNIIDLGSNKIFFKIQINSYTNFFSFIDNNYSDKEITCKIFYDNKNLKLTKKNLNKDLKSFKEDMVFIKTTGKHISEGHLLMKNKLINKNKIENKDIFFILKKYFKS